MPLLLVGTRYAAALHVYPLIMSVPICRTLSCSSRYGLKQMLYQQKVCAICPLVLYPACQSQGNLTILQVHVGASW